MSTAILILAAGKGSRMRSDKAKVLHEVANLPLLGHVFSAALPLDPSPMVVITGHNAQDVEDVAQNLYPDIQTKRQEEQLGTAHAVAQAASLLEDHQGDTFVLYGDTPFIRTETLQAMQEARKQHDLIILGFHADNPGRYGRLVMQGNHLERIVEYKDATPKERNIKLCNSGVLCGKTSTLFSLIQSVKDDNAAEEYYLTDCVEIARKRGLSVSAVICSEDETLGINTRAELADAEQVFQKSKRKEMIEIGVTLLAPETVFFSHDTYIGPDCVIEPYVIFGPETTVENDVHIRSFSHIEGAHISRKSVIGPYARLRSGAELAENCHIGNFVEIKNTILQEGVKANHLTYLGDADIGRNTNIGAGTITCNYDGVSKHKTHIGRDVFIGSDTMLVAPVSIGDEAMTGSGSVITSDVPAGALAIERCPQKITPGFAQRFFARLRQIKTQKES